MCVLNSGKLSNAIQATLVKDHLEAAHSEMSASFGPRSTCDDPLTRQIPVPQLYTRLFC